MRGASGIPDPNLQDPLRRVSTVLLEEMPPILNAQSMTKQFGAKPLFQDISFTVDEGARIGLIGPNGAGKSTLLAILAGQVEPDSGELSIRKRARATYVPQDSRFAAGLTIRQVLEQALAAAHVNESEREGRLRELTGRAGFADLNAEAASLSGGWRKRLAITQAMVIEPEVMLLDEPTNHLDLAGIEWLEELLTHSSFAAVTVLSLIHIFPDPTRPEMSARIHRLRSESRPRL